MVSEVWMVNKFMHKF